MTLHEWEIWHTYSTYLKGGIKDLSSVARGLVKSGLALCAIHRDGETYWQSDEGVRSGITTIKIDREGSKAEMILEPSDEHEPSFVSFAQEAWYQAAYLRFGEIRLFGEDLSAPPPYIRAFLGQYTLTSESKEGEQLKQIVCYPIVKLYESGVLLLEVRIASPQRSVETDEFIREYVNLYRDEFDNIEVSPALAKLAPRAYLNYTLPKRSMINRLRLRKVEEGHDEVIEHLTETEEGGDFTFKTAPLPSTIDERETLISLAMTIFDVVSFVASQPRVGLELLIYGQRPLIQRGNYWEGRPHIHILRHDDQMETATENEERHRESFGWILSRVSNNKPEDSARYLPSNARSFNDYAAYITRQATLWVWAKRGVKAQEEWVDANRGHLIYEHQAHAEMLEYGYMLHRSLAESAATVRSSKEVLRLRANLSELKSRMRQSSHYGEVAELLERGWETMGVQSLREDIAEALAIRQTETQMIESSTTERIGRVLTIVFGLVAVPPIASDVIQPIWELLRLWRPTDPAAAKLFMVFVAFMLALIIIYGLSWGISKSDTRKNIS